MCEFCYFHLCCGLAVNNNDSKHKCSKAHDLRYIYNGRIIKYGYIIGLWNEPW